MSEVGRTAWLAKSQADLIDARESVARALAQREQQVAAAHAEGWTIYRISKVLGITQGAVRRILGL